MTDIKIGDQFIRRSFKKNKKVETVRDILTTTNQAGLVVGVQYLVTHDFLGQQVTDRVVEATIRLGTQIKENA